jgi:hypothetical protein
MARHLAERVHAGVGPTGDLQGRRLPERGGERRLQLSLDRPQPGLARPAGEARPVVLE